MGVCWYCWWGWPKAVRDIFNEATAKLDGWYEGLTFGPGHIVWADENFGDDSIELCLKYCDEADAGSHAWIEFEIDPHRIAVVRESLLKLKALPAHVRDCEPEDYDEEHPENFPPPIELECEHYDYQMTAKA